MFVFFYKFSVSLGGHPPPSCAPVCQIKQIWKIKGLHRASAQVAKKIWVCDNSPFLKEYLNCRGEIDEPDSVFYTAQVTGRSQKNCRRYRADCPVSVLNLPSAISSVLPIP